MLLEALYADIIHDFAATNSFALGEGIFQDILISQHFSGHLLASIESTLLLILALLPGESKWDSLELILKPK